MPVAGWRLADFGFAGSRSCDREASRSSPPPTGSESARTTARGVPVGAAETELGAVSGPRAASCEREKRSRILLGADCEADCSTDGP
eukprot:10075835-Alexandrium_andersonii.AAC.1